MSHDEAWRFLVLGRSLEQVDMTARLLLARMPATPYEVSWPMLLRSCGAFESFIRTRTWAGDPRQVVEFLLMDRLLPRSVVHALATAEEVLAALDPMGGSAALTDRRAGPSASCAAGWTTRIRSSSPACCQTCSPRCSTPAGRPARRSPSGISFTSSP
jgi:uncharacterized alpha-E superfamily protein